MIHTYNITYNIKYGSDTLQYVNLYVPDGRIEGTVLRIHGGSWRADINSPSITTEDPGMASIAAQGYVVIDANYRGVNSDGGSQGDGQFPNDVNDIVTILNYCNVKDSGNSWSPVWNTMYDLIHNNGGLLVTGTSAGGHLCTMGTCTYGTSSGIWPRAMASIAGPMNLNPNKVFIEPMVVSLVLDQYVTPVLYDTASPEYNYGTASVPGPWFNAVNSSPCKFYFTQNNNDTLVTNVMSLQCLQNFETYNSAKTELTIVTEGPPRDMFAGTTPIAYKGTTPSGTTATLPASGNTPGDAWLADNQYWVYNQGSYPGDGPIPASINGFTRWFDHNYTTTEPVAILDYCTKTFGGTGCKNSWWRRNGPCSWRSACLLWWRR